MCERLSRFNVERRQVARVCRCFGRPRDLLAWTRRVPSRYGRRGLDDAGPKARRVEGRGRLPCSGTIAAEMRKGCDAAPTSCLWRCSPRSGKSSGDRTGRECLPVRVDTWQPTLPALTTGRGTTPCLGCSVLSGNGAIHAVRSCQGFDRAGRRSAGRVPESGRHAGICSAQLRIGRFVMRDARSLSTY